MPLISGADIVEVKVVVVNGDNVYSTTYEVYGLFCIIVVPANKSGWIVIRANWLV